MAVSLRERRIDPEKYPALSKYAAPLPPPAGTIVGREREVTEVLASLLRPRLSNLLLLAPPGSGKTVLVQEAMTRDVARVYLEMDLARLQGGVGAHQMAGELKTVFDELERYSKEEGHEIVLFIDELHQIVQMDAAAVEALKPILASSGARGLKIIGATTFDEWVQYIRPNKPLDERLQRVNLDPAGRDMTIKILRTFAEEEGVGGQFASGDGLLGQIHDLTNLHVPSSVQPRSSIGILDGMIGWHRLTGERMDFALLAKVMRQVANIDIGFTIDGRTLKAELDKRVFSQKMATTVLSNQLQVVAAGLNDPSRPKGSFLLSGSTGVGKTELTKQLVNLVMGQDSNRFIRFDMSEFAIEETMEVFRSELTKKVVSLGHAVILLDEIEKAHFSVVRLLLQVLDDARLTDDNGRQVSFHDSYIVLTTNAGNEVYKTIAAFAEDDEGSGSKIKEFMPAIENSLRANKFPPELLGRLDKIIPFQPLSTETKRKIVERALKKLQSKVLDLHGVQLGIKTDDVLDYLTVDMGKENTDAGGAREAVRMVQGEITEEVARFINAHPEAKRLRLYIEGNMRARDTSLISSEARPKVEARLR